MRALLDINVLIALLDADHLMHAAARRWLGRELDAGWASCPVTQNGVLRILSQPAYPNHRPVAEVAEGLAEACRHPSHRFWTGGVSLIGSAGVNWRQLLGHRQVTDAYLLAVAVAEGGRFVSFDQRISVDLVPETRPDQLVVIESEER
jgi:toxin-antitoxin system PIN domain toxin